MLNLATKVWAVLAKLFVRFFLALARSGDVDNQNVIANQIQKGNQQAIELKTMTKTMSVN